MANCTFCYRLTRVVPDKVQRAVKWLCVYVCPNTLTKISSRGTDLREACPLRIMALSTTQLAMAACDQSKHTRFRWNEMRWDGMGSSRPRRWIRISWPSVRRSRQCCVSWCPSRDPSVARTPQRPTLKTSHSICMVLNPHGSELPLYILLSTTRLRVTTQSLGHFIFG